MHEVQRWAELDADFQLTDIVGGESFRTNRLEALSAWTITAPHAVAHLDERGTCWPADRGTGGLAMVLHELGPARVLTTAGRWDADADSVPTHLCPYKSMLLEEMCPTVALDLHEGSRDHDLEIDAGTRPELVRGMLNHAEAVAERHDLNLVIRNTIAPYGHERVLDAMQAVGIPAMRLSISPDLLDPWTMPIQAGRLLHYMKELLTLVDPWPR